MSTQPKYVAILSRLHSAKLYRRRGIVQPQRLSDEAIRQLPQRRAA
jgi:hypothetical protein